MKKGAKTVGREALKTGLNIAEVVVAGKNLKQATKIQIEINGTKLLQKAIITVGPPGERSIKRAAKRKRARRVKTKLRNTSKDLFV